MALERILVVGGTRFLGKRVVERLAAEGTDVTVLSRRRTDLGKGINLVCGERVQGLHMLAGQRFDVVLDFICYDGDGPNQVLEHIATSRYVMISSSWVPRLWSGNQADELCPGNISLTNPGLSPITNEYLSGKIRAEWSVAALRRKGFDAVSLRLPIILGDGDHTGRLDFYCSRFSDNRPVIVVDGGSNKVQIAWVEDMAKAITYWIKRVDIGEFPIWEGLPDGGQTVKSILLKIAKAVSHFSPTLVDVPAGELAARLPDYLAEEPLWRETALGVTQANLFASIQLTPTDLSSWVSGLTMSYHRMSAHRCEELIFLENR
ncbi:MAG: NAD-dependent epimerase/dehydratase family protein [Syntrophaceae bacterium]|nr:NAD-dependent epimerase/dehydratase family protein [Syntrophaceae bacterium]